MGHTVTPTRMLKERKKEKKKEGREKEHTVEQVGRTGSTAAESADWHIHFGKLAICTKAQQLHSWEYTQQRCMHRSTHQKICSQMLTAALFLTATNCKHPTCLSIAQWINKMRHIPMVNNLQQ